MKKLDQSEQCANRKTETEMEKLCLSISSSLQGESGTQIHTVQIMITGDEFIRTNVLFLSP